MVAAIIDGDLNGGLRSPISRVRQVNTIGLASCLQELLAGVFPGTRSYDRSTHPGQDASVCLNCEMLVWHTLKGPQKLKELEIDFAAEARIAENSDEAISAEGSCSQRCQVFWV
ncbi:hypothetical protein WG66_015803 [Moniliophthora roreri]|uniref:Uncharacterized protein n=1 Tax=Moniliophthora roreri TaxID=221103 RepID=A0A0W0FMH7_MONRR|nr:hypothetical protein WG66_015803 [Moniliophthora roreri]